MEAQKGTGESNWVEPAPGEGKNAEKNRKKKERARAKKAAAEKALNPDAEKEDCDDGGG